MHLRVIGRFTGSNSLFCACEYDRKTSQEVLLCSGLVRMMDRPHRKFFYSINVKMMDRLHRKLLSVHTRMMVRPAGSSAPLHAYLEDGHTSQDILLVHKCEGDGRNSQEVLLCSVH